MTIIVFTGCWIGGSLLTIALINRYRNFTKTSPVILVSVFLSWILPISLTFLLPIDIASTRYEQCLETHHPDHCHMSWLYSPPSIRHYTWLIIYWTLFLMTWIVVPFLQGYELGGQFTTLGKCWFSLKINFFFYGMMVLLLVLLAAYLRSFTNTTTFEGMTAFLMALTNAGGLMAVMIFLGHGLVRLPRHLWQQANARLQLKKLEGRALAAKEALDDAEHELSIVIRQIHTLPYRVAQDRADLRFLVEGLIAQTPLPTDEEMVNGAPHSNGQIPPISTAITEPITLTLLETLNFRLPMTLAARDRATWEWRKLLEEAWHWQDVLDNERLASPVSPQLTELEAVDGNRRLWTSNLDGRFTSRFTRSLIWWWYCYIRPGILRSFSWICAVMSLIVFWSEVTLTITGADISLMRALLGVRVWMADFFASIFLLYMAFCTYSSFLRLRIFSYLKLVPGQHTDTLSLLFFAAYITRLTFPLGYNFVTMVDRRLLTQFAQVMGTMNLVPLLGQSLNYYVPIALTFICGIFLFRLHSRLQTLLRRFSFFQDDQDEVSIQGDLADGANLIAQARRDEERIMVRRRVYGESLIPSSSAWRLNRSSTFPVDNFAANINATLVSPRPIPRTMFGVDESPANSPSSPLFSRVHNPWATS